MTLPDSDEKLRRIRNLVNGVGRTGRPDNGMDMLADAVLRILDEPRQLKNHPDDVHDHTHNGDDDDD